MLQKNKKCTILKYNYQLIKRKQPRVMIRVTQHKPNITQLKLRFEPTSHLTMAEYVKRARPKVIYTSNTERPKTRNISNYCFSGHGICNTHFNKHANI